MKKFLLALILLSGCDNVSFNEQLKPTRNDLSFSVKLHIVPEQKINDTCHSLGLEYEANGCSTFNTETKECNIYVMIPRYVADISVMAISGHELWHCSKGKYHE